MLKKIICALLIVFIVSIYGLSARTVKATIADIEPETDEVRTYDVSSNYYSQVDDKTQINLVDDSVLDGYTEVASDSGNTLYVDRRGGKLNIAVKLSSGYIFYSDPNYYGYNITAYQTTGGLTEISSTLLVNGQYSTSIDKNQKPVITYDFESVEKGFKATINFDKLGIIINIYVYLDGGILKVFVPDSEIEENGYSKTTSVIKKNPDGSIAKDENGKPIITESTTNYNFALAGFTLFPYFGCVGFNNNFENRINGYDFIPDGSGALSRFQYDRAYLTRLQKRIYGDDMGIKTYTSSTSHLSDTIRISLPIYGVVHGYNQYAFINTITSGDGQAELILEPFGYGGRNIQTTYFRFLTREQYSVALSTSQTGSTTTLPTSRYADDVRFEYSFLTGSVANYSGIASYYRDNYLNLVDRTNSEKTPLGLNVLAQDYKKGLFGKNFIKMTTYKDLSNIVRILEREGVENFSINYTGWNRGGFYNNNSYKPKVSYRLGTNRSLKMIIGLLTYNGYNIESPIDILTSYNESKKGVVKKTNLDIFKKYSDSSLFDETYLMTPVGSSEKVTKYKKQYDKFGFTSINLGYYSLNNFQYRYKSVNYSRDKAIKQAVNELSKISDVFDISLMGANSYSFDYLSRFYEMEHNATGYTYLTDSVPFISLILSGYAELFSKEINFQADYNQLALRLVEYNIYPYFTITNEDSSKLRYTNSEYLYTSKFSLWEDDIVKFYSFISGALNNTLGEHMVMHETVSPGVTRVTYSNNVKIYINYNNQAVNVDGVNLSPMSYEVKK